MLKITNYDEFVAYVDTNPEWEENEACYIFIDREDVDSELAVKKPEAEDFDNGFAVLEPFIWMEAPYSDCEDYAGLTSILEEFFKLVAMGFVIKEGES
jgi:hypothetical protein